MIRRIHHIAVAVEELASTAESLTTTLDREPSPPEDVTNMRTRAQFFTVGETRIELVAPMGEDSPIGRHLARKGPGLHHICLEVDDLEGEMTRLRAAGMRFVTEDIQRGAHGAQVVFLHPRSTGGVLIELQQAAGNAVE
jgi:methylmalonyl-CoA/ethylmalonyl-CoA epimerase